MKISIEMLKTITTKPVLFVLIHCFVWWVMIVIAKPTLDGYGDMAEVYAWSQHWLAGSDKHPQFLPWMTKIWFSAAPHSVASFYMLSAVNLAVAMYGILALGRALKFSETQILVALALGALALPYLTLPAKLNMNTICLTTWPWVAWAFVKVTDKIAPRRILYSVLFGALAAVSMLSKYYSIVLLIPLFGFTLMPRQYWLWKTVAPWTAILVFLALTMPHLLWLLGNREALAYASEQGAGDGLASAIYYILKFMISPLIYWPISFMLAIILLAEGSLAKRVKTLFRWPASAPLLGVFALGPWLMALFFAVVGLVELSTPWAIPIGFAFLLYILANAPAERTTWYAPKLARAFVFIWPVMIGGGIGFAIFSGQTGYQNFYRPDKLSAAATIEHWHARHEMPLSWISKGNDAATLALLAPKAIEALPGLPDALPSYYPHRSHWQTEAGVIFCSLQLAGNVNTPCLEHASHWATANGMASEQAVLPVKRTGLRFPKDMPYDLAVVYVWPK